MFKNCSICGGSSSACKKICNRDKPAFRPPKVMVDDILFLQKLGHAPIFLLNDFRMAGPEYTREFFTLLEKADIKNELIFDLFSPADEEFFRRLTKAVPKYSIQLTLESHLERIRKFKVLLELFFKEWLLLFHRLKVNLTDENFRPAKPANKLPRQDTVAHPYRAK